MFHVQKLGLQAKNEHSYSMNHGTKVNEVGQKPTDWNSVALS
jgi:hypothetical protein